MSLRRALEVAGHEMTQWLEYGSPWRLVGLHLSLSVSVILLTWPSGERMSLLGPVSILKWYALVQWFALCYVCIKWAADAPLWYAAAKTPPREWVRHGVCTVMEVTFGKLASTWTLLLLLLVAALPLASLATVSTPFPAWLKTLAIIGCDATLFALLGLMIGASGKERAARSHIADAFYLAAGALALVGTLYATEGPLAALNPLIAIDRATSWTPSTPAFPWSVSLSARLALIAIGIVAVFALTRRHAPVRRKGVGA